MSITKEQISGILETDLHLNVPGPDTDLVAEGLLDSLALVDLVLQLETKHGISIDLESIEIDDLRSVNSIYALVEAA